MALEAIGAAPIINAWGEPVTLAPGSRANWMPGMGLCAFIRDGAYSYYGVITLDGVFRRLNTPGGPSYSAILAPDVVNDVLLCTTGNGICDFDSRTGHVGPVVVTAGDSYARVIDRYLRVVWGVVQYLSLDGVSYGNEFNLGYSGAVTSSLSLPRKTERNIIYIGTQTGRLVKYDHVAKTRVGVDTGIERACIGLIYARDLDIFLSLHAESTGLTLRRWANSIRPVAISAPTAIETVKKGHVARLRCRVTGSYGEPSVNRLVDWRLSGTGSLAIAQSHTDADGYAYVDYAAACDGGLGTVRATVRA